MSFGRQEIGDKYVVMGPRYVSDGNSAQSVHVPLGKFAAVVEAQAGPRLFDSKFYDHALEALRVFK